MVCSFDETPPLRGLSQRRALGLSGRYWQESEDQRQCQSGRETICHAAKMEPDLCRKRRLCFASTSAAVAVRAIPPTRQFFDASGIPKKLALLARRPISGSVKTLGENRKNRGYTREWLIVFLKLRS